MNEQINFAEQYRELRAAIDCLMSCESPELKFVLNHNLKHILKKHDKQNQTLLSNDSD